MNSSYKKENCVPKLSPYFLMDHQRNENNMRVCNMFVFHFALCRECQYPCLLSNFDTQLQSLHQGAEKHPCAQKTLEALGCFAACYLQRLWTISFRALRSIPGIDLVVHSSRSEVALMRSKQGAEKHPRASF